MTHIVLIDSNTPGMLALEAAQRRGFRTTFIRSRGEHEVFYRGPLADRILASMDEVIEVPDTSDETVLEPVLRAVHARTPIDAVFATLGPCVLPLARAAHRLGLRGTSEQGALHGTHKDVGRRRLVEAGIPSIEFALVRDWEEARAAADRIRFPLVAKPSRGISKFLTQIVHDHAELEAVVRAFFRAHDEIPAVFQRSLEGGLLLEEHMTGTMLSAEVAAVDGRAVVLGLASRRRARYNEILELGSNFPAALSPEDEAATRAYALQVADAFGLDLGMFHIEIMLTADGPRLVEANPRLGGGAVPQALGRSLGANVFDLLLDIHLGKPITLPTTPPTPLAMVRLASRDGGVVREHDLGWLRDYERYLLEFSFSAKPGSTVPALAGNTDYIGTMMVRAETPSRTDEIVEEILSRLSAAVGFEMAA